jgi:hypothetical protein
MALRTVRVAGVPEGRLRAVLHALSECESMIRHVDCFPCFRWVLQDQALEELYTVSFNIRAAYVAVPIKKLKSIGASERFGEIDIANLSTSTEELPVVPRESCTLQSLCPSAVDRQSTLEIHSAIESQSHINVPARSELAIS